jgi:hypothetical protein
MNTLLKVQAEHKQGSSFNFSSTLIVLSPMLKLR